MKILRARFVLPCAGGEPIVDGCVAIAADRVAAVGRFEDVRSRFPGGAVLDYRQAIILPGLINAHQHGRGLSPLLLGYRDDALEPWIAARRRHGPPDIYAVTRLAAEEMLANGVTATLHANYSYGSDYREELGETARAYRDAGIRATICIGYQDRGFLAYENEAEFVAALPEDARKALRIPAAPPYAGSVAGTIALMEEMSARFGDAPLITFAYGPAGPQWVSDEAWTALARDAARRGVGLHFHLLESPLQAAWCRKAHGGSTLSHLRRLGVFEAKTSCAHGVYMSEEDMTLAREEAVVVVANPGSNLRLFNGPPPVAELHRRGCVVAVGTDNTALADDEDYLAELRLYASLARTPGIEAIGPSPAEILRTATINGGKAAFLSEGTGSLEPGQPADLVAIDCARFEAPDGSCPRNALPLLLARAKGTDVALTMTAGVVRHARRREDADRRAHWRHVATASVAKRETRQDETTVAAIQRGLRGLRREV
ncbi:amidohydrolase family protein [Aurantimonas sp. 22II-16-19i]|uniref:amidohydrolase family protein n=1 Tax=Aurantimonas sp. 22II-16-19i TaxID=1317114 RepID=UPI0009F7A353|nr:amidohydrolase family protein [Aurantimonas sp. 22II-16-19i]ORE95129.1 amidohydrolase [Aurantimonas sp. 22II-16-19i]